MPYSPLQWRLLLPKITMLSLVEPDGRDRHSGSWYRRVSDEVVYGILFPVIIVDPAPVGVHGMA